jgi:hypothetical protein
MAAGIRTLAAGSKSGLIAGSVCDSLSRRARAGGIGTGIPPWDCVCLPRSVLVPLPIHPAGERRSLLRRRRAL